jgi:hypothetical protein
MKGTALLILLGCASVAWADGRELYTTFSAAPSATKFEPAAGTGSGVFAVGPAFGLGVFYGVSHTVHVGARFRFALARDVAFERTSVMLPDGSRPSGMLYENATHFDLTALLHYRFDTGEGWAPFFELEAGGGHTQYSGLQQFPSGTTLAVPLADVARTAPVGRGAVGMEWRLWNRLIVSAALAGGFQLGALAPWALELPVSVGVVWW